MSPTFAPPTWQVTYADVNKGVPLCTQKQIIWILDALYTALLLGGLYMVYYGKVLNFIFPSDLAICIWDGAGVPDFRIPKKNYAWARYKINGIPYAVRLFNVALNDDWTKWLEIKTYIPGSDEWYYRDSDGTVKKGKNCTVPRGYNLVDVANDVFPILIIIAIIIIFIKLRLDKVVVKFIKALFNWEFRAQVRDIHGSIDKLVRLCTDISKHVDEISKPRSTINLNILDVINQLKTVDTVSDAVKADTTTIKTDTTIIKGYTDSVEASLDVIKGYTDEVESKETSLNQAMETLKSIIGLKLAL